MIVIRGQRVILTLQIHVSLIIWNVIYKWCHSAARFCTTRSVCMAALLFSLFFFAFALQQGNKIRTNHFVTLTNIVSFSSKFILKNWFNLTNHFEPAQHIHMYSYYSKPMEEHVQCSTCIYYLELNPSRTRVLSVVKQIGFIALSKNCRLHIIRENQRERKKEKERCNIATLDLPSS